MNRIDRILVPTALDAGSAHALRRALLVAGPTAATVEVLYVISPAAEVMRSHLTAGKAGVRDQMRAQEKLEAWVAQHAPGVEVDTRIAEGEIVRQIVKASLRADIVVLCSAGRDEPGDWVFGTKTERILARAEADIWVVRAGE